jgi:hypothetical protein
MQCLAFSGGVGRRMKKPPGADPAALYSLPSQLAMHGAALHAPRHYLRRRSISRPAPAITLSIAGSGIGAKPLTWATSPSMALVVPRV